jgi:hypothetical protein
MQCISDGPGIVTRISAMSGVAMAATKFDPTRRDYPSVNKAVAASPVQ